ncbi:VOC family protein [Flavobacteriaceae bacterium TP-CH-4]|uniref:VOC family protein n=1 Tax=Pelagihabitans pacificus TaxID=2696054 RepID=A0A967E8E6_9FLAO|nr:VOC family protein [Pelagihabitans pacificus]NHF61204.1 VOC family protein [Pelagihabitans pacificus]
MIENVHHIAIICSDYERSKSFYTTVLGLEVVREVYREGRQSYKLDLALNGRYIIELFSFPHPPKRISRPEATGLRHLAFEVDDIGKEVLRLKEHGITAEAIRIDELTQKRYTFFSDPDDLPIEFYET